MGDRGPTCLFDPSLGVRRRQTTPDTGALPSSDSNIAPSPGADDWAPAVYSRVYSHSEFITSVLVGQYSLLANLPSPVTETTTTTSSSSMSFIFFTLIIV